jgi:hypothetical protein
MGLLEVETWAEAGWLAEAASCSGFMVASAIGSFFFRVGEGVSTNMIEGPAASSRATAVRGVRFDVNFGNECSSIGTRWANDLAREEDESWDEVLAVLRAFFALFPAFITAVSEAMAPACGLRGVTESTVGLAGVMELLLGEPCEPFQIAFLRSNFREKKWLPVPAGEVFALESLPDIWPLPLTLSSEDASRSYSSKLLPLIAASLSEATASSSASSS